MLVGRNYTSLKWSKIILYHTDWWPGCSSSCQIRNSTSLPLDNENGTDSWTDLGPNTEGPNIPDVQPQLEPPTPPERPDVEPQISHSVRHSNWSTQGIPPDYLTDNLIHNCVVVVVIGVSFVSPIDTNDQNIQLNSNNPQFVLTINYSKNW